MHVPELLKSLAQWMVWKYEPDKNGRPTKVPYTTTGRSGSSTNPATWCDLPTAQAASGYDGIGFAFKKGGGIFGIDLDGCLGPDGELADWAIPILNAFPTYTEVSPSQTGLKIFAAGNWGRGRHKPMGQPVNGGKAPAIEVYGQGRYFTVTGQQWEAAYPEIVNCQDAADELLARFWPAPERPTKVYVIDKPRENDPVGRVAGAVEDLVCGTSSCHNRTLDAACCLVHHLNMRPGEAFPYLRAWCSRGTHEWSDGELWHKLDDAEAKPVPRGKWLSSDEETVIDIGPADYMAFEMERKEREDAAEEAEPDVLVAIDDDPDPIDPDALPISYLRAPGFISDVIDYNLSTTDNPLPELAFAGALALLATLTGRKVQDKSLTRTNIYVLGLAPIGAGKEHARTVHADILEAAKASRLLGWGGFASGVGLVSALAKDPCLLFQTDEISKMLRAMSNNRAPAHLQSIVSNLLQFYSSSHKTWRGEAYADRDRNVMIDQPHLVVYGSAPPDGFWTNLNSESVQDGLLARMMVFESGYVVPGGEEPTKRPPPAGIVEAARYWSELKTESVGNLGDHHPVPHVLERTPAATERFRHGHMIPIASRRVKERPEQAAIWSRTAEKTAKLAILFACSRVGDVGAKIELCDMDRAIRVSNWLTRKTLRKVFDHVSENEQEAKVKKVLKMLGRPLTKSQIIRKTQWLVARERDDILKSLVESGTIRFANETTATKSRLIYTRVNN